MYYNRSLSTVNKDQNEHYNLYLNRNFGDGISNGNPVENGKLASVCKSTTSLGQQTVLHGRFIVSINIVTVTSRNVLEVISRYASL